MRKSLTASTALAALLIALFTLPACKKKDLENTYLLSMPITFTAPAHGGNSEFNLVDTTISSLLSKAMNDNGISMDRVKSVKLNRFVLQIVEPSIADGRNFDPLIYANAHIRTSATNEHQLAFIGAMPQAGLTEITLESQHAEWIDYFKAPSLTVRVKGYTEEPVPATHYRADVTFDVVYDVGK